MSRHDDPEMIEVPCAVCYTTGSILTDEADVTGEVCCPSCYGKGWLLVHQNVVLPRPWGEYCCPLCDGARFLRGDLCGRCDGRGSVNA